MIPGPRTISHQFHTSQDVDSTKFTHMVTQWGQFLDHDIALTPENNRPKECCQLSIKNIFDEDNNCFPIPIQTTDSFYAAKNVSCLDFHRSLAYCEENGDPRQQFNAITHFVDASNVYASDPDIAAKLRTFVDGKLKVGDNNLLPRDTNKNEEFAGDARAREMPSLAAMHTLFVREHNRICDLIKGALASGGSGK